ncbi:MAG: response regulator [Candidatus Zixiibacteriota bacterium]
MSQEKRKLTQKEKILIVDDEEIMRSFLLDVFMDEGYDLDSAANGEEALEKISRNQYQLIITDIRMPGVDGTEVLKKAKELNPKTEVIIITGYASPQIKQECQKLGAAYYIAKPFQINQIRALVNKLVREEPV